MKEETKKQIDEMDYGIMLSLWRFARIGHPMLSGETGDYFAKVMKEKTAKLTDSEKTAISNLIGWENE